MLFGLRINFHLHAHILATEGAKMEVIRPGFSEKNGKVS